MNTTTRQAARQTTRNSKGRYVEYCMCCQANPSIVTEAPKHRPIALRMCAVCLAAHVDGEPVAFLEMFGAKGVSSSVPMSHPSRR